MLGVEKMPLTWIIERASVLPLAAEGPDEYRAVTVLKECDISNQNPLLHDLEFEDYSTAALITVADLGCRYILLKHSSSILRTRD